MSERDTRPTCSPMPEHLAAVYDRYARAAAEIILTVFHEAMEAGVVAPAAERENDAFSLASQVVSIGLFALVAQMADMKRVPIEA